MHILIFNYSAGKFDKLCLLEKIDRTLSAGKYDFLKFLWKKFFFYITCPLVLIKCLKIWRFLNVLDLYLKDHIYVYIFCENSLNIIFQFEKKILRNISSIIRLITNFKYPSIFLWTLIIYYMSYFKTNYILKGVWKKLSIGASHFVSSQFASKYYMCYLKKWSFPLK